MQSKTPRNYTDMEIFAAFAHLLNKVAGVQVSDTTKVS